MQQRATAILDAGHPDGFVQVEEGEDGGCYKYVREQHPPKPSIPHWHPGVTVWRCSGTTPTAPGWGTVGTLLVLLVVAGLVAYAASPSSFGRGRNGLLTRRA
jgi:hypothetical protein